MIEYKVVCVGLMPYKSTKKVQQKLVTAKSGSSRLLLGKMEKIDKTFKMDLETWVIFLQVEIGIKEIPSRRITCTRISLLG